MLIAYLTLDEVNWDLARQLAEDNTLMLYPLAFTDLPVNGRFDAVVYDLDSFPAPERQEVLSRLLCCLSLSPVAVHSYRLEEDQVHGLRRNGVVVHPRLAKAVFLKLTVAWAGCRRLGQTGA